ncbi:zf-HC2 domain-containing protein [Myxococcus stipitatus]|uniref:zf-HC2 domain-containing protein n=1 Tax=Myxococcus stipitatus TaxID=83455 RepID=UPI003144FD92
MKPQNVHAHEDRLLDFAYGELPVSEAQVVESHLQGCPRCTQTLNEIRGVRVTMAQLSEEPAPDAGLESLLAYAQQSARRAAAGPVPQPSRWRRWLLPVVGLASAGTLSVLTFMAVSPELTRPHLSSVEAKRMEAAHAPPPPMGGTVAKPTAAAPFAEAPAQALADANQYGGDKDAVAFAKEAAHVEGAEAERAQGWEEAGSGGGVGPRRRADERKAQAPSAQKASREKAPGRMAPNLDVEGAAALDNVPSAAVATAPSPPRDALRLGGGGSKQESSRAEVLGGPAKSWDEAPGAPALESVTEPLARGGVAASAPAPVDQATGRVALAEAPPAPVETAKEMPSRTQQPRLPTAKKAKGEVSLEARAAPAAEPQQESDDQAAPAPRQSVAELSRLAQEAYRAGNRAQEVSLLRLALDAGATGSTRMDLLSRVCDAELALGRRAAGVAACQQVLAESPGSQAAQAARRRLSETPVSGAPENAADAKPAE